jgi:hypothetical protein
MHETMNSSRIEQSIALVEKYIIKMLSHRDFSTFIFASKGFRNFFVANDNYVFRTILSFLFERALANYFSFSFFALLSFSICSI